MARLSVLAVLALVGCLGTPGTKPDPTPGPSGPDLTRVGLSFDILARGLDSPVDAATFRGALLVVEQPGVIRILRNGTLDALPFLDIRPLVLSGGERGLLGLAIEADAQRFYVDYTRVPDGATVVARYRIADGRADPLSAEVLLTIDQPFSNHNGGALAFGPDGYLYVGMGDGGSGGDPQGHGQNRQSLLGKILRLDVAGRTGYAIPPTNPFATGGGAPEVWAYGLRNPWRISFDRETGDLWIGDVGQNRKEEIDFQPRTAPGGANFGWNVWEGSDRFRPGSTDKDPVAPVAEYAHEAGRCSVTGGHVVRGSAAPLLRGVYLYGDYCTGEVWGLRAVNGTWESRLLQRAEARIASFAVGLDGAPLLLDHAGNVLRVVARSL